MGQQKSKCQACYKELSSYFFETLELECNQCQDYYKNFNNYITSIEEYKSGSFTPVHKNKEDYSSFFRGTITKYTPNNIIFLINSGNMFWYPCSPGPFQKDYKEVLCVPKGIFYYEGSMPSAIRNLYINGKHIYIPKVVIDALMPLSLEFRSQPLSELSIKIFINNINSVLDIQNKWEKEYYLDLEIFTETYIITNIKKLVNKIRSVENSFEDGIIAYENANKAIELDIKNIKGEVLTQVLDIQKELKVFKKLLISIISNNTSWGTDYPTILEICQVRNNPLLGNLVNKCPPSVIKFFRQKISNENIEGTYIIHYVNNIIIRAKIIKHNGNYKIQYI